MTKLQSAMEYLMTYGWAILVIAVVLAALVQLGIFRSGTFEAKAAPGSCQVARPNGRNSVDFLSLSGTCLNQEPQYVAHFTGSNSYVSIPNSPAVQLNGAFTVSYWVHVNSVSYTSYDGSFSQGNAGSGGTAWIIYYGIPTSGVQTTGPAFKRANVGWAWNGNNQIGVWHNFVITYDGSNALTMYENGSQTRVVYSVTLPADTATTPLNLGRADAYGNQYMSNVQIYNISLSSSDVQTLFKEGIGGAPIDLIYLQGWWPLNGNANDYSGNAYNGNSISVAYAESWTKGYSAP